MPQRIARSVRQRVRPFLETHVTVGIRFSFFFVQVGVMLWMAAIIAVTAAFGLSP